MKQMGCDIWEMWRKTSKHKEKNGTCERGGGRGGIGGVTCRRDMCRHVGVTCATSWVGSETSSVGLRLEGASAAGAARSSSAVCSLSCWYALIPAEPSDDGRSWKPSPCLANSPPKSSALAAAETVSTEAAAPRSSTRRLSWSPPPAGGDTSSDGTSASRPRSIAAAAFASGCRRKHCVFFCRLTALAELWHITLTTRVGLSH